MELYVRIQDLCGLLIALSGQLYSDRLEPDPVDPHRELSFSGHGQVSKRAAIRISMSKPSMPTKIKLLGIKNMKRAKTQVVLPR